MPLFSHVYTPCSSRSAGNFVPATIIRKIPGKIDYMKRDTQYKFHQLKFILVSWVLMGILFTVYDCLMLSSGDVAGPSATYTFWFSLAVNCTAGFIGAVAGGSLLVFYINTKYRHSPYAITLMVVCGLFLLIWATIVVLIGFTTVYLQTGLAFRDPGFATGFKAYLHNTAHLKAAMQWISVVAVTQLLLQVNDKLGRGLFRSLLTGRYNRPQQEKKIFMFLDINSSTTIAEQLGDKAYHNLLKDFFADITFPILDNKGFIYQYVGDEVVIAWNYEEGIQNMQCIQCFYAMKASIEEKKEKYLNKYGLVPSFKAGMHSGTVIGGEIGVMKRDLTYSGDVLNTTARILSKAGELKEELLSSTDLLAEMKSISQFITRPLGAVQLKGKASAIRLSALMPL